MLIKSRIPEIFLGALLATALIAMGAVFGSSQVSTPAARNSGSDKGGNESTKAGQSKSEWMTSENLLALFTLGLVIVGGVQLWLFFVQLRLIRESLDDAKLTAEAAKEAAETSKLHADIAQGTLKTMQDTAERQLRAYVLIPSAHVKNIAEGNGPPVAHVQIKNFGQTPAYKVVNIGGFAIDRFPPPASLNLIVADQEFATPGRSKSDLAPTQHEDAIEVVKRGPLSDEERRALSEGGLVIYVYGEIRYIDVFGRERWTKYRLMMGGPVGIRPGGPLVPCEEGNDAT